MKVTLKQLKTTFELEKKLLKNELEDYISTNNYKDAYDAQLRLSYVNWILNGVLTGYIYTSSKKLYKKGIRK